MSVCVFVSFVVAVVSCLFLFVGVCVPVRLCFGVLFLSRLGCVYVWIVARGVVRLCLCLCLCSRVAACVCVQGCTFVSVFKAVRWCLCSRLCVCVCVCVQGCPFVSVFKAACSWFA